MTPETRNRVRQVRTPWLCIVLLICGLCGGRADIVNRWSFNEPAGPAPANTICIDSVHAAPAVIRGVGAAFTDQAIVLPGTTNGIQPDHTISAYIDLPNGLIS